MISEGIAKLCFAKAKIIVIKDCIFPKTNNTVAIFTLSETVALSSIIYFETTTFEILSQAGQS